MQSVTPSTNSAVVSLDQFDFIPNYDESSVPKYTLPEALRTEAGEWVNDSETWTRLRRPEILELFRRNVYGQRPPALPFRIEEIEAGPAFGSLARREQVRLHFGKEGDPQAFLDLLIYRPLKTSVPSPIFLGLNFHGNETTTLDPAVRETESWGWQKLDRGETVPRWPFEEMISRGYAVATFHYADAAPDDAEFWREGFSKLIFPGRKGPPLEDEPGAIAWWAWGLSRALDYLFTRSEFEANLTAVIGHSRQGKAALWAAAEDERFAMAVANNSGCTGATLSRRCFGERAAPLNARFPYWCCGNYRNYDDRENELPIDQHQLLALIAPRALYVASGTEDLWADPRGEFLSASAASPVYELFEKAGVGQSLPPLPDTSIGGRVGYHLRTGIHDITAWDWRQFGDFADRNFGRGSFLK